MMMAEVWLHLPDASGIACIVRRHRPRMRVGFDVTSRRNALPVPEPPTERAYIPRQPEGTTIPVNDYTIGPIGAGMAGRRTYAIALPLSGPGIRAGSIGSTATRR